MDQVKDILRQCVKYRFWIAFGIAMLLPMIGYFVGVGGIIQAKVAQEAEITKAKNEIGKYATPGIVNNDYKPLADRKNAALAEDVDESWRKLRALQEPLLRWPAEVEAKFLRWGRKFPTDVDRGEVTRTLVDYTYVYPGFVSNIYKIFKPFNFEDGTGIVVAPDENSLLRPLVISSDNLPDLSKVWAEQERLWVVTALLDAVAKINDSVKATNWDNAIVKQINLIEVGSPLDQDQKSLVDGVTLVPADLLVDPRQPAAAPVAAPAATPSEPGGPSGRSLGASGPGAASGNEVYYLKTEAKQYKSLPIMMTVLVDQAKLPDFLVGLENSPITIQVNEAEIARPLAPVVKPVQGDRSPNFGSMSGGGGSGGKTFSFDETMPVGGGRSAGNMRRGGGNSGEAMGGPAAGMMPGMGGRGGNSGGNSAAAAKGIDVRNQNKNQERKEDKKKNEKKADIKPKVEQYTNIVEVTVYGQARFYLAPPPRPESTPSTSVAAPAPPATAPAATPPVTPATAPAATPPAPPATAPAATPAPKADAPKADAPKADAPKADAPKADAPK